MALDSILNNVNSQVPSADTQPKNFAGVQAAINHTNELFMQINSGLAQEQNPHLGQLFYANILINEIAEINDHLNTKTPVGIANEKLQAMMKINL